MGNKPKKFDYVHQTVSCREACAGGARDYTSSVVTGNQWAGCDSDVRDRPQFKQRELPQSKVAVVHTESACWVREEVACSEITSCPEPSLIFTIRSSRLHRHSLEDLCLHPPTTLLEQISQSRAQTGHETKPFPPRGSRIKKWRRALRGQRSAQLEARRSWASREESFRERSATGEVGGGGR